jgi:hypothetical protein
MNKFPNWNSFSFDEKSKTLDFYFNGIKENILFCAEDFSMELNTKRNKNTSELVSDEITLKIHYKE